MRIGILGAGAAGLSAAYFLRDSRHAISVHEASGRIGGLAGSFRWHGFDCDLGPHRLHCGDAALLRELTALAPLCRLRRRSRIYVQGRWLRDPLRPFELLLKLPPRRGWRILRSYLSRPQFADDSFASLALNRFGEELFSLFFKPYSEKLFGVAADQIAASWGQRKLRLGRSLLRWRRDSRLQFSHFHYPRSGGYGAICAALHGAVRARTHLRSRLVAFQPASAGGFICTFDENGATRTEQFDYVISTLPVTYVASLMGMHTVLRFRPMRLVYLLLDRARLGRDHWFYLADADKLINRVAEFKNFTPNTGMVDKTVICCEVTEIDGFSLSRVISDLAVACGVRDEEVLDVKTVDLERAYPIYDRSYDDELRRVGLFFAEHPQLIHLGRSAQFAHEDVDEIFAQSKSAVTAMLHRR